MWLIIFNAFARQRPQRLIEIEFAPLHLRDLVAPRAGEREQLDQWTEWPTDLAGRPPRVAQFQITEHAITRAFGRRRLDAGARRRGENVAADAPVEKLPHSRQSPIGCDRRPAIYDAVQHGEDVAARDLLHAPAAPARKD